MSGDDELVTPRVHILGLRLVTTARLFLLLDFHSRFGWRYSCVRQIALHLLLASPNVYCTVLLTVTARVDDLASQVSILLRI